MPRFDGTGPMGAGPMTGRGMGPCANRGRRGGWFGGTLRSFWRGSTDNDRVGYLRNEAESLKAELKEVESELSKYEK